MSAPNRTGRTPAARARQLANLQRGGGRPVEPGEQLARRHGGYGQVTRDRLTAAVIEIYDALAASAPLREAGGLPIADEAAVHLAAEALCRFRSVSGWLGDHGWLDAKGNPRETVLDLERRLSAHALDLLDALGMHPRARAKLGVDLAQTAEKLDLAQAWASAPPAAPPTPAGQREAGDGEDEEGGRPPVDAVTVEEVDRDSQDEQRYPDGEDAASDHRPTVGEEAHRG